MRRLTEGSEAHLHRKLALACALLLGSTAASAAADPAPATGPASAPAAAPVIHVENIEHDFGNVWTGPDVEHAFTVYNRGNAPLQIRGVRVDCGCTSTGEHPKVIEPGQSGKFPFRLKTIGLNGRIAPKKVRIASNDPVTPELVLHLLGTFKKRIEVSPMSASFGTIITTQPLTRVVKIKNNTDQPLQLKLQAPASDQFKFELTETEPGKAFDLTVSTLLPYKPGIVQAVASLETSLAEEKVIRVVATGRVPERLDLYPQTANYVRPARLMPGQNGGSLYFWLNNYGASLVNVKQASVDDPAIKTTVEARSPGKNYRIQVEVPLNAAIPPQGRTLTVETDDPEKPTLQAKIIAPVSQNSPTNAQAGNPSQRPAETMVGQPVPSFSLKTFEGVTLASDDLKDKITILNFVSPTCGFCKQQIPLLEKIRETYAPKGVRFVNVMNTNPTGRRPYSDAEITQLMTSLGSKMEVAADAQMATGRGFRVTSYPTCVVVGKDGKVAAVDIGSGKVQLVPPQLDALLAGKPIPAAAMSTPPAATRPAAATKRPAEMMVGQAIPSFALKTFDGTAVASDDVKDRITVLNFVSPTCGYCKKQIPELEKIREAYAPKGVRFVNVMNMNPTRQREYTQAEITQLMTSLNSRLEVAADPGMETGSKFRVTSYPTCMVLGKNGLVAAVDIGSSKVQLLPGQLDALLAGKPVAPTAQ